MRGTNPEERGPSICNIIARVTCMELRLTNSEQSHAWTVFDLYIKIINDTRSNNYFDIHVPIVRYVYYIVL